MGKKARKSVAIVLVLAMVLSFVAGLLFL